MATFKKVTENTTYVFDELGESVGIINTSTNVFTPTVSKIGFKTIKDIFNYLKDETI